MTSASVRSRLGLSAIGPWTASPTLWLAGLAMLLVLVAVVALAVGAMPLPVANVCSALAVQLGLEPWTAVSAQELSVVWHIRLPRVLLGVVVGAGLATSGATLQGVLRNPLGDPALVGVSTGAALAAALVLVLGEQLLPAWSPRWQVLALPLGAFGGGLLATAVMWWVATRASDQTGVVASGPLILAGVAVNAACGAGLGGLTLLATDAQLRSLSFWNLGSLGGASWPSLAVVAMAVTVSLAVQLRLAPALDAWLLGDAEAQSLGVSLRHVQRLAVLAVALAVGACVATTGVIGFVGLVAPHLIRLAWSGRHRHLLPGSALVGGVLVVASDSLARTILAPIELPLGVATAGLGVPFFVWLLGRNVRPA
jgi:iron complex transport system permease protein